MQKLRNDFFYTNECSRFIEITKNWEKIGFWREQISDQRSNPFAIRFPRKFEKTLDCPRWKLQLVRKVGRMNNPGLSEMENTTSTPANPKKRKRPSIYDVCTPIVMKKQRTTPPVVSTLVIYPFSIPFLLLNNDLEWSLKDNYYCKFSWLHKSSYVECRIPKYLLLRPNSNSLTHN